MQSQALFNIITDSKQEQNKLQVVGSLEILVSKPRCMLYYVLDPTLISTKLKI